MRRDEREVTDLNCIFDILTRCTVIRLGLNGGNCPYIVPLTFGCRQETDGITVYFHCAGAGRKWSILMNDPKVCLEADIYERVTPTEGGGLTALYESVIGTGTAERITEQAEKIEALKVILDHYQQSGFPASSCKGLSKVEVFRVRLDEVTAKHNLSGQP